MNVKLVWATPEADKMIAEIARVSNPDNQKNPNIDGLLKYMMREGHTSPFEMANACIEITTTRDIGRQILRHRSFNFQEFCVAEGTLITTLTDTGRTKKIPIETLFAYQFDKRMDAIWQRGVRVYDESTKTFTRTKIKEVFNTGVKECFKVTLSDGKVLTCTNQHKFFTRNGFAALENLKVGAFVAVNGETAYKSYEWMAQAKQKSLSQSGRGVAHIADMAGCSYHTIRKWLKLHGLQFTKLECAIVNGEPWNKNLPKEEQPLFGKTHNLETRLKMHESSRKGAESEFFRHGKKESFRKQVWNWSSKWKNYIIKKAGGSCELCGSSNKLQIDHIKPVYAHPELAFEMDNVQALCCECHRAKTTIEKIESNQTVRWKEITTIESVGELQTYDLEVEHSSHNYVANGIVTHNSQRYQSCDKLPVAPLRECRLQDTKNRQNSIVTDDYELVQTWELAQQTILKEAHTAYQWALEQGIAKEQARALLPEGLTSSRLYMNGTMRSWIHYLQSRLHESTQKEHRDIAVEVLAILRKVAPVTMAAFFD